MTAKARFQRLSAMICGAAAIIVISAQAALAQPATCDPKYWDSLKARAWTEAQREIEQNQNLIYKADSVLEYTCFDRFLRVLAGNSDRLFSGTTRWGQIAGPDMAAALTTLVLSSLISGGTQGYINQNFKHNYLGGRGSTDYAMASSLPSNSDHYSYDCDAMNKVWMTAKCQDFINTATSEDKTNTAGQDDFFYMSAYSGTDYRRSPTACTPAGDWANRLSLSTNAGNQYPKETYNTYVNFFNATSCTGGNNANGATALPATIPTGITVTRVTRGNNPSASLTTNYPEIICVVPG